MKICKYRFDLCLARRCMTASDLRSVGISPQSITRAVNGQELTTRTVGRIARALGVDVSEIMEVNTNG